MSRSTRKLIESRLRDETGTVFKEAPLRVGLVYPSPYHVGMSSLGFQVIYGLLNARPDTVCERAFLPDDVEAHRRSGAPLLTYETRRPLGDCDVIALSLAYELELAGVIECLDLAGLSLLAADRGPHHPLVIIGGPLTFSNPLPAGPFADLIVVGEAEDLIGEVIDRVVDGVGREQLAEVFAGRDGVFVPRVDGDTLPTRARAADTHLPARGVIVTPNTELANMFLVEAERGCSRACAFCVMRRGSDGGMRLVSPEQVLSLVPSTAPRVGLVGAAVSDHPDLAGLLRKLVESDKGVGVSSLRADRLDEELVALLARGGYRTLTVASDGASERLRRAMFKRIKTAHLVRAAELARGAGLRLLKVYMIVGVPGETEEDLDELVSFTRELAKIVPVALGTAPFVAKRHTPMDGQPYAGIKVVSRRMKELRRRLRGVADVRSVSARWAWVEYVMAQGGQETGLAVLDAWRAGASFADYRRAFVERGVEPVPFAGPLRAPKTRAQRIAAMRGEP